MNKFLSGLATVLFMFPIWYGIDSWCTFDEVQKVYDVNLEAPFRIQGGTPENEETQKERALGAQIKYCATCTTYSKLYGRGARKARDK